MNNKPARKYYAADNAYGSATSRGFANTEFVLAFDSRKARDEWVRQSDSLAARAILRREVTAVATVYSQDGRWVEPRPFSGEYWGIVPPMSEDIAPGLLGTVEVCGPDGDFPRLY